MDKNRYQLIQEIELNFCHPCRVSSCSINQLQYLALIGAFVLLCLASLAWAGEGSNLLDGMAFVGKNGEVGKDLAEYEDEEIVFQDGMFTSVSCEPYNSGSSPYNAKVIGDKIYFDAVTESPTHGKITWNGLIKGDEADVTFVWTKEYGTGTFAGSIGSKVN